MRNQLRSHSDRAKTAKRKRRHVRAELAERRREAAAPERRLAAQDLSQAVRTALASLPDRQQVVFLLVKVDGKSYEDAAIALGISAKTVHQHLARGSERLRELLAEYRVRDTASYALADEQVVRGTREGHQ